MKKNYLNSRFSLKEKNWFTEMHRGISWMSSGFNSKVIGSLMFLLTLGFNSYSQAPYCAVNITYGGEYTSSFVTTGAANNINYTASSAPLNGYSDQTALNFLSFATQVISFSNTYVGGSQGLTIWVDWNNDLDLTDPGEQVFTLTASGILTGSFTVPTTAAAGDYRMRVRNQWNSAPIDPCGSITWGNTIDYKLTLTAIPTCLAPAAITASNVTTTSATLAWTEQGTSTDWDIEYGIIGFIPTGVPTISVTANPTPITNLLPNTSYSFYVRSVCSLTDSSTWTGPYTFITLCTAFSVTGFCEGFEDNSPTINCWRVINANNDGDVWGLWTGTGIANTGANAGGLYTDGNNGNNNDYLITPNLILTGNEIMKFSYRVMSASEPNDFQVLLSTTGVAPADFSNTVMALGQYSNIGYKDTVIDLSAFSGPVYIAFHVPPGGLDGWYIFIDDVCFDICTPTPGVSGTQTICSLDDTLDLNTVITQGETNGVWEFDLNPNALNGSDANLAALPYGTSTFSYIVTTGCTSDTTTATITVVKPSSAGSDGSIAVCRNQPFNLLQGLGGSADLGGVWTNPNASVVTDGNAVANNIPGQYNYRYIVSNGVCPADTSKVIVNVLGSCDYLGLEDVAFEAFNMYPNPTADVIFITNSGSTEVFNYEVLDMNGRVILRAINAINGSSTTELNLSNVETGVYMIRVFNDKAEKTFRVVKN
jgi:hypothetical protein